MIKAGQAKNTSEKATEKEKIQVEVMGAYDLTGKLVAKQIKENIKNNITGVSVEDIDVDSFPVKIEFSNGHKYQVSKDGQIMMSVNAGDTAPSDSNAVYSLGVYTAVIPAGFTVSDVKVVNETTGVVEKDETTIENGLVVKDKNQNEWVWIPVYSTELAMMYTKDNTGWTMSGTQVVTQYKSSSRTDLGLNLSRVNPGESSYREPDVNNNSLDKNEINLSAAGLGVNINEAAIKLRDDYKSMIDSVKKYAGFYVGRYELSNAGTKKNQTSLNQNWYYLYDKCRKLENGSAQSTMIWSCQWDMVCSFVRTAKDADGKTIDITDSRKYGNYKNSQIPANNWI